MEPGMLMSVKSDLMSASVSKNRRASSAFPASSTRYPASKEHVGCPQSLKNIVFDNQNYGVGGAIGRRRQPTPAVMVPYLTVGNMNRKAGAAFGDRASAGAVSPELADHAFRHAHGHPPPAGIRDGDSVQFYTDSSPVWVVPSCVPELSCVKRSPGRLAIQKPWGAGARPETFPERRDAKI